MPILLSPYMTEIKGNRAFNTLNRVVVTLVLASQVGLPRLVNAEEIKPSGWPVPDVKGAAKFYGFKMKDIIDEVPGAETRLGMYKAKDGTRFNTLEVQVNGKWVLYGFYVDTDGKRPMEYVLIDRNGDGKFEVKDKTKGSGPTPQWVIDSYAKL